MIHGCKGSNFRAMLQCGKTETLTLHRVFLRQFRPCFLRRFCGDFRLLSHFCGDFAAISGLKFGNENQKWNSDFLIRNIEKPFIYGSFSIFSVCDPVGIQTQDLQNRNLSFNFFEYPFVYGHLRHSCLPRIRIIFLTTSLATSHLRQRSDTERTLKTSSQSATGRLTH